MAPVVPVIAGSAPFPGASTMLIDDRGVTPGAGGVGRVLALRGSSPAGKGSLLPENACSYAYAIDVALSGTDRRSFTGLPSWIANLADELRRFDGRVG